ncbi:MAG: hypothetical protein HFI34_11170 [Lachnospiraceae bacterium]|nr:hypothetical protein [Lachnospiraceae bacterium]
MKHKKLFKTSIIGLILIIMLVITNFVTYAFTEKTLIDIFFSEENEKNKRWIMDMIVPDGQVCMIDNYKITLKNLAYCRSTKEGYCEFIMENDQADLKTEYYPNCPASFGFGKEGRFHIFFDTGTGSVAQDIDISVKNNIMYLYYYFQIDAEKDIDKLYIYDYDSGKVKDFGNPEVASAEFQLTNTVPSLTYFSEDDIEISLSPFSFYLMSKNGVVKINELEVFYTDGTSCPLVTDGNYGSIILSEAYSLENEEWRPNFGLYQLQCSFNTLLELKEIDYILFNGEKLLNHQ